VEPAEVFIKLKETLSLLAWAWLTEGTFCLLFFFFLPESCVFVLVLPVTFKGFPQTLDRNLDAWGKTPPRAHHTEKKPKSSDCNSRSDKISRGDQKTQGGKKGSSDDK